MADGPRENKDRVKKGVGIGRVKEYGLFARCFPPLSVILVLTDYGLLQTGLVGSPKELREVAHWTGLLNKRSGMLSPMCLWCGGHGL